MICAVLSARLAGLERIKLGTTSRLAKRSPIFGASRLPRSFKGRSLSGNAGSSRLDLAWRTRNRVFMACHRRMAIRCPCAAIALSKNQHSQEHSEDQETRKKMIDHLI